MHHLYSLPFNKSLLLLFCFLQLTIFNSSAQKVIKTTFKDFQSIENKSGHYKIFDIHDNFHKVSLYDDSLVEFVKVTDQLVKIDSSIFIDYTNSQQITKTPNDSLLFNYCSKYISPPRHGGTDSVIVSFVIGQEGEIFIIRILEGLKNNVCKGKWKIYYPSNYLFTPLILSGRKYTVEYIVKIGLEGYCVPLIKKG